MCLQSVCDIVFPAIPERHAAQALWMSLFISYLTSQRFKVFSLPRLLHNSTLTVFLFYSFILLCVKRIPDHHTCQVDP